MSRLQRRSTGRRRPLGGSEFLDPHTQALATRRRGADDPVELDLLVTAAGDCSLTATRHSVSLAFNPLGQWQS